MIKLNDSKLYDELLLVIKLFYTEQQIEELSIDFFCDFLITNNNLKIDVKISDLSKIHFENSNNVTLSALDLSDPKKYIKRYVKIELYKALVTFTGKTVPWGSLTGIRPTKVFYELKKELNSAMLAREELVKKYLVSPTKAEVAYRVTKNQTKIIINDNLVDFYVNIPFCPSRCYYCSFISTSIDNCKNLVEPYVDAVIKEIRATKQVLANNNYIVKSIYVGGGTPTSIAAEQLDRILKELNYGVKEFTVEAGRPDTITTEKLDVLKKNGVTRISINPQTFSNSTLKSIGRNHTNLDIINAYKLAKPYGFIINMDLIAGLYNESFATFKKSLTSAIDLDPDNITVHTLSVKKNSELKDTNDIKGSENEVVKMVEYAYKTLTNCGYEPYYLYKQKNMIGNLENIGYTKPGRECIFNIDSMEEVASIVACGAYGISKRYFSLQNRIERLVTVKNINVYLDRIDEFIAKKQDFFK